jgi:glycosyltransferase 2 family protein
VKSVLAALLRRRRVLIGLQLAAVAILLGFLTYGLRDAWADAAPRLRDANPLDLLIACVVLAVYYLLFVIGWRWILAAMEIHVPYRLALQAEMVSMLAKYVPGGIWTPAARVVALRRAGVTDTPRVLASVLVEGGLSAIAGVLVFVASLPSVGVVDAPLVPLVALAVLCAVLLHPRVFRPVAAKLLRPFGASEMIPLRYRTLLALLVFYSFTWLVGGAALFFLLRAVGGDPALTSIAFLGGTSAVGAIVAVLSIIFPSGLGVREASMYALVLTVASEGVALGATVLNRITITLIEALLLLAGGLAWRFRPEPAPPIAELVPEPARQSRSD